jgi:hypothetical protein
MNLIKKIRSVKNYVLVTNCNITTFLSTYVKFLNETNIKYANGIEVKKNYDKNRVNTLAAYCKKHGIKK